MRRPYQVESQETPLWSHCCLGHYGPIPQVRTFNVPARDHNLVQQYMAVVEAGILQSQATALVLIQTPECFQGPNLRFSENRKPSLLAFPERESRSLHVGRADVEPAAGEHLRRSGDLSVQGSS